MNTHDLKIIFRRLVKEKLYSVINVGGLALGMAAALLIFLFLMFELSFDRYHKDAGQIYRIGSDVNISGEASKFAINSMAIGPLLVNQLPEFSSFVRIFPAHYFFRNLIYRYKDKHFSENGIVGVDSTFFNFFSYRFIEGQPESALTEPFSLVMTESMARRYFEDQPALNKIIEVEGAGPFRVTAVVEDPPLNTHIYFSAFFSLASMPQLNHLLEASFGPGASWPDFENTFGRRIGWVYVKTTPGFDPQAFIENHWYPFYEAHIGNITSHFDEKPIFQPLTDIHLKSKLGYEMVSETGIGTMMSPEIIHIFFVIALFLLVIASINYTNVAISRFSRRGKEVGVKKVLGAGKGPLIRHFFAESVITTLLALMLALLLVELSIPFVNDLLGVKLSVNVAENPSLLLLMAGVAIFSGLIAGGYPALYFSSFSPLKVLGYRFNPGRKTLSLKKALIVLQFVISVFMIIATLVVNRQLNYINNKDLGYNHDRVLIVEMKDGFSRSRVESFRDQLIRHPSIEGAAISNYFPSILTMNNSLTVENESGPLNVTSNMVQLSPEYFDFMQMELSEGRFFNRDNQTDFSDAVIINEAAKRFFGWENALGQNLDSRGFQWPDGTSLANRKVIGVVKDFHYSSLNKPIDPMVIYPMRNQGSYLNVRFVSGQVEKGLEAVKKEWNAFRPNYPLESYFLGQVIDSMYQSQRVLGIFFAALAWLCIIIAFLGLYGLSAFSIEQRTREIGIRKVLGASFGSILRMLSTEFFWLIVVAVILAGTAAFLLMTRWLDGFAYHTRLSILPFVVSIGAAFLVAFLAIVFHAWKASRLNPAISLKYE